MNKIVVLFSFVSSFGLSYLFIKQSKHFGLVDIPNHRSSHSLPTPKGGGLALYLSYNLCVILAYELGFLAVDIVEPLLFGSPVVAVLGWLDDQKNLPAKLRLLIHLIVSALIFFILTDGMRISFHVSYLPVNIVYILIPFVVLYISWFINLYNFMDGVDGMAGATGLVVSLFLATTFYFNNLFTYAFLYSLLSTGIAGFLILNWSPAKIFLGDTGAYFLGFMFSTLSLVALIYEKIPLHVTIICFAFFITDTTYTLIMRAIKKQNVFEAHRQFAFHKFLRKGNSHQKVSLFYALVSAFWLCPLAYLVFKFPEYSNLCLVVAFAPLIYFCYYQKAGSESL